MAQIRHLPRLTRSVTGLLALALLLGGGPTAGARSTRERPSGRNRHRLSDEAIEDAVLKFASNYVASNNGDYIPARQDAIAFRRLGLGRVLDRVCRMQREESRKSMFRMYAAFVLAYAGVDYRANVRRIAFPVTLWDRQDPRWERYDFEDFEDAPPWLARLYQRHRDPALLRTLFTWHLDGGPAGALPDARYQVLVFDPPGVMQILRSSPTMTAAALATLPYGMDATPGGERKLGRRIQTAMRQASPRLRAFARGFLARLHAQVQRTPF